MSPHEVIDLMELNAELLRVLAPLARAADEFQWVIDRKVDPEGVFLWSVSSNHGNAPGITAGDAFRARAALAKAKGA